MIFQVNLDPPKIPEAFKRISPGELVQVTDFFSDYLNKPPPKIGMLLEIDPLTSRPYVVLLDGEIRRFEFWNLKPVETRDEEG